MNNFNINQPVNTQLVESLVKVIRSLSPAEQALLQSKLLSDVSYPSNNEIAHLMESGGNLDFLHDEPDIYTIADREAI
ncbi:hypothetical protein Riv7116_5469 [Rivularia sp. PCC 7116]|uniref:hypothetical protein n=1 Tax=Rivularia sp. PCC 7116 TaxID=373994 RepID=UPI00029F1881|nr:hypothetical protein [Rivularia sp. PCC 7116]AFY57841.1 hypothetical protein Riv7116_5469 [Rivularia sp. PCC 7116]